MSAKPKRADLILFLACVAIALAPLALRGTTCGQDFDFHLESWMGVSRQWLHGNLFPHWIASANYGAGEPRFIFYPPLSWILGGILGTFLPWTWTQIAFILICLLAMGAACYKMACAWMPDHTAAIAACLYVVNPYILFVIYERSALAELLAAVWLPLLILYALRPNRASTNNVWADQIASVPPLALVVAALWLTDTPAAVMGSYALAVVVAVASVTQRRWTLLLRAASGMALGLALAAVYLIPAVYEQQWIEVSRAFNFGLRIQDSFLFEHTGMAYHDQVLRSASWIAVILIGITLLSAFIAWLSREKSKQDQASPPANVESANSGSGHASWRSRDTRTLHWPLLVLAALITFLLFPASQTLWYAAPKLHFLQFPWRWLLVLGLICAIFAAQALSALASQIFPEGAPFKLGAGLNGNNRRHRQFALCVVLALAAILITHAWRHYWQLCDDEDNVHAQLAARELGFEGTDEYTPKPADNGDIQQNLAPVRVVSELDGDQADSSVEENPDWQPDEKALLPSIIEIKRWNVEHMTAEVQSPQPGYAVLRLMDYPAWRVTVNGESIPRPAGGPQESPSNMRQGRARPYGEYRPVRDDGLLTVPIPAGTSTIDVRYTATPDVWAGRAVSFFSFVLWLLVAAKSRRHRVIM
jgi:hypothetical protein